MAVARVTFVILASPHCLQINLIEPRFMFSHILAASELGKVNFCFHIGEMELTGAVFRDAGHPQDTTNIPYRVHI